MRLGQGGDNIAHITSDYINFIFSRVFCLLRGMVRVPDKYRDRIVSLSSYRFCLWSWKLLLHVETFYDCGIFGGADVYQYERPPTAL